MGKSLSDLYGDLMLIPCPPGIPVSVLLLLPLVVFLLIAVFRWSGRAWCIGIGSWRSLDVLGRV